MLTWVWVAVVVVGCKNDDVNPVDKLMGFYEGQSLPGLTSVGLTFRFEKKSKDQISIELKQFRYKREAPPNRGYIDYFLDHKFPNCKMVFVDTTGVKPTADSTGLIFKKATFAKIINNETNRELGTLSGYESRSQGKTIVFVPNFYVRDTIKVFGFAFKLKWE